MQRLTLTLHKASVLVQESRSITKKAIFPLSATEMEAILKWAPTRKLPPAILYQTVKYTERSRAQQGRFDSSNSNFSREGERSLSSQTTVRLHLSLPEGGELQSYLPAYICWQPKCLGCPGRLLLKALPLTSSRASDGPNKTYKAAAAASHRAEHRSGSCEEVGAKPLSKILWTVLLAYLEFEFL